jgi:serine/threonine protein phosphatase 1
MRRTFVIGDIHGDLAALTTLLGRLPELTVEDTIVFLGDFIDRGPHSAEVVELVRALPEHVPAKIVALRGNHEDAWLRVIDQGWPGFLLPSGNGCMECLRSYRPDLEPMSEEAYRLLERGGFFPPEVVAWMRELSYWYEDDHAIYVHAGMPANEDRTGWLHPSEVEDKQKLLWMRSKDFFRDYKGKIVVVGHTVTSTLPPELSQYTPEDPDDLFWAGKSCYAIDTGAGKEDGFLTALELPAGHVYESRLYKDEADTP